MSLLHYERKFASLRMNAHRRGHSSPHKVAMLLAVIDLMEQGKIPENKIWFDEQLRDAFKTQFEKLASPGDRCTPHNPFFHLRTEGFWHHHPKIGRQAACERLSRASPVHIANNIMYAYLDDELYEYLHYSLARELLRTALLRNLNKRDRYDILKDGKQQWSLLECEALVSDYFKMLHKALSGKGPDKEQHRKALAAKLNDRSHAAIDSKHRNVSAILVELDQPYIQSYKPAYGYPEQLKLSVLAHLAGNQDQLERQLASINEMTEMPKMPESESAWNQVLDQDVPEKMHTVQQPQREFLAKRLNFAERERFNRKLGDMGEEFVMKYERFRMEQEQRPDLAKEVEWTSKEKGDGLGYDIRSFDAQRDRELFIEVKTTNSGKHQPFFITENEVEFSRKEKRQYKLYRVYNFRAAPRLFQLPGAVDQHVHLSARNYKASFS